MTLRALFMLLVLSGAASAQTNQATPENPYFPTTGGVARCVEPASVHHGVNSQILLAIIDVESNGRSNTVSRNSDNSVDVGITGINSIHYEELAKFGILPGHLLNDCVATYVAAWKLRKKMIQYGNTWFGIAAYHSKTPYYNTRYQVLLRNALVRRGVLAGPLYQVPPLIKADGASTQIASSSVNPTNQK